MIDILNNYGQQGWEVVTLLPSGDTDSYFQVLLKREIIPVVGGPQLINEQ